MMMPGTSFPCQQGIMKKETITFQNRNRAMLVTAAPNANPKAIVDSLKITSPRAVILLFGGASGLDDSNKAHLTTLFADGIVPVATDLRGLIVDGGTQSGVMAMMGEAIAQQSGRCPLLGIAPAGKVCYPGNATTAGSSNRVPLEPNHSHFVLVESDEWGDETQTMLEIARAFNAPIAAVLVNGGAIAADEALQTVRNEWQLVVIEGSGRFADEVSAAVRDGESRRSESNEIACSGRIVLFHIDDTPKALGALLRRMLMPVHPEPGLSQHISEA